ncbi:MAG: leucyl/phenylalanyl-tRNA--protein transferase [Bdellovibrionia bacterium]
MAILEFPNPRLASPEGIVALGGDLEPESLVLAYRQGIFPWPIQGLALAWFCPPERAILEWDRLHRPRSLARFERKKPFQFSLDQNFDKVIFKCSKVPRPGQEGTWITKRMLAAYKAFHQLGHAHSVEVWKEDVLVGGLYGVDAGGVFAGESMFYAEPNASKLAILFLMDYLHSRGSNWMDIQMMTPHMEALGARLISRNEYLEKLAQDQARSLCLF